MQEWANETTIELETKTKLCDIMIKENEILLKKNKDLNNKIIEYQKINENLRKQVKQAE